MSKQLEKIIQEIICNIDQTLVNSTRQMNQIQVPIRVPKTLERASYHQDRMWFIDSFERGTLYEGGPSYHNIPLLLITQGKLNHNSIRKSLELLIQQHSALRTRAIFEDSVLYQNIYDIPEVLLEEIDWTDKEKTEKQAQQFLLDYIDGAFKNGLDNTNLFKAVCLQTDEKTYLLLVMHHLICDDVSKTYIKEGFLKYYTDIESGKNPHAPFMKLEYADFSEWQREQDDEIIEENLLYWKRKVRQPLQPMELPIDRKREAIHIYEAESMDMKIPKNLQEKVESFVQKYSYSKEIVYLTAFKILLMKYSTSEEVNIGTSIKRRINEELKGIVGPISNLVLLHDVISDQRSFLEIVEIIQQTYKEAENNSLIPFDRLVMELKPQNDMSRTALFDVLYNYEEAKADEGEIREIPLNLGWGKYDYNLLVRENGEETRVILTYNKLYYEKETAERLLESFIELCVSVMETPEVLVLKATYLPKGKTIQYETPIVAKVDICIHTLFEQQVRKTPNKIAVVCGDEKLSYIELNSKANQLAKKLRDIGVQPDEFVALMTERSLEMIIGILAIIKAGGAYLPIDATFPKERIAYMLEDSKAKLVLKYKTEIETTLPVIDLADYKVFTGDISNLENKNVSENIAYIIYTSGTTGNPKGVMIEHRNVSNMILNTVSRFDLGTDEIWTMFHSYNFDFSVWEMYGALLTGGKLVIVQKIMAKDTRQFQELLEKEQVTILSQTPAAFDVLKAQEMLKEEALLSVKYVIFGGEALEVTHLKEWHEKYERTKFINMYGITETTVHVTYKAIIEEEISQGQNSVGKALPGYSVYVVDKYGHIVPTGVIGEMAVGGIGVARGYLNWPELTAERFIQNPFGEGRLYLSGDLARYNQKGELEYCGRKDEQVKIRGYRIELGEIKNAIMKLESVKDAAVIAREDRSGETAIC
ncbi:MAG TPA: amino acid adenylation domain-containing protein, partial [Anaerovoracaceae bacterium]|nr:amino acid adenylation domain-containing protein [Anaerovoracaceae bacterium]